jgi:hypothetical protein
MRRSCAIKEGTAITCLEEVSATKKYKDIWCPAHDTTWIPPKYKPDVT